MSTNKHELKAERIVLDWELASGNYLNPQEERLLVLHIACGLVDLDLKNTQEERKRLSLF